MKGGVLLKLVIAGEAAEVPLALLLEAEAVVSHRYTLDTRSNLPGHKRSDIITQL
jgi:hypothetical protein